jgi:UTP--glucose-1-phosphate uridylyltransferase
MPKKVKKAVIAAAGMGTRFLPQTKAMPKEMLPIIDKPIIQKIVEDAVSAGVEDVIIVTSSKKRAIEDHFDKDSWLVDSLMKKGKEKAAKKVCAIAELANFVYIRQKGDHMGNSVPLMNASHLLDNEPFFYFYADDYFEGEETAAKQMLDAYNQTGNTVLPLIEIDKSKTGSYGIVDTDKANGKVVAVKDIVEKPEPKDAPTTLASVHGYLFSPEILKLLPDTPLSDRNELEIQWSIAELAKQGKVSGVKIDGEWRDAGNKLGYLTANIKTALQDEELRKPLLELFQEELDK